MAKFVRQLIADFLILCLVADLAPAALFTLVLARPSSTHRSLFDQQAIAPVALENHQRQFAERVPFIEPPVQRLAGRAPKANGLNHKAELPWMIGNGNYASRVIPTKYKQLLTPHAEALQLISILTKNATPDVAERLSTIHRELAYGVLTPVQMTEAIRELRRLYLSDPPEAMPFPDIVTWSEAISHIESQLDVIKSHWGLPFGEHVERLIGELETYLPLTGKEYDNFERYVRDEEHGLLHSLKVIDEALRLAKVTFDNEVADGHETSEWAAQRMEHAKEVYAGVGLYHDLTGLRERNGHNRTAQNLVMAVMPQIKDNNGSRMYSDSLVHEIAEGALRHRGQNYEPAITMLQKIFVDVDEYILIQDIERILRQPAEGAFQYRKWDVYRRYIIDEFLKYTKNGRFIHEAPGADFFQYLIFTLMYRTNPDRYHTAAAKQTVSTSYYPNKVKVLQYMDKLLRDEMQSRGAPLYEFRDAMQRVDRVITELEAMIRGDKEAQKRLWRDVGSSEVFVNRIRSYLASHPTLPNNAFLPGPTREALHLLTAMLINEPDENSNNSLLRNADYYKGLGIFVRHLEQPNGPLTALENGNPERSARMMAGFAGGLMHVVSDRLQDLYRMVLDDPQQLPNPLPDDLALELSYNLAEQFLYQVNLGASPADAVEFVRAEMDQFRFKVQRPAIWDMPFLDEAALAAGLRKTPSVNSHIHTTGALPYEMVSKFYRMHPRLCPIFVNALHSRFPHFKDRNLDPRDPSQLRSLAYGQADVDSSETFEIAFLASRIILENDTDDLACTRAWYKQIILNSAREGNRVVGVLSTFTPQINSVRTFRKAVDAAIRGIKDGEQEIHRSGGQIQGVLFLAFRKEYSPEISKKLLKEWLAIRRRWQMDTARANDAKKLFGVDSVGYESGEFDYGKQIELFREAKHEGQWVRFHAGEWWKPGKLGSALGQLELIVKSGAVDELVHPIALMVKIDRLRPDVYSEDQRTALHQQQRRIIKTMKPNKIFAEYSPTSNDFMSRASRREEGWKLMSIAELIALGIQVIITDDDPGVFDTTFTEEYLRLIEHRTAYGYLCFDQLRRLLKTNAKLLELFESRLAPPLFPSPPQARRRSA